MAEANGTHVIQCYLFYSIEADVFDFGDVLWSHAPLRAVIVSISKSSDLDLKKTLSYSILSGNSNPLILPIFVRLDLSEKEYA